ncbi:MAG: helix-turn-helix transcriptional regulator [Polyangiaceae bacterium]
MKRTERLFALAEALRARRTGVTAEELSERFGVAPRTIYRDLDALRAADLPLQAERGRGGGFALDRSYSLPPVNFTAREAALLVVLGKWMEEMRLVPLTVTLHSAVDKVRAALPTASQRELQRLAERLQFIGVPGHASKPDVRKAVERAFFDDLPLRITYMSPSYVITKRRVRVRAIVMERSETRLNCDDLEINESRQFRLDRIQAAEVEKPAAT